MQESESFEETIDLLEIAQEIAEASGRKAIRYTKLLSLLRSGQIETGFYFEGSRTRWIRIPDDYWKRVTNGDFRAIQISSRHPDNTGSFQVKLKDFIEIYLGQVKSEFADAKDRMLWKEIRRAIRKSSKPCNVLASKRSWDACKAKNNIFPDLHRRGKGGRREKKSWKQTGEIIAAYLIAHHRSEKTRNLDLKVEIAADHIASWTRTKEIQDPPGDDSIRDFLRRTLREAEEILDDKSFGF